MSYAEWIAEGTRLFGQSMLKWRFVCPACGHNQAVEDFRPFKEKGADADSARFNCIGRYSGANPNAGMSGTGKAPGPCNYTSGGLFDLRPVIVVMDDGTEIKAFAFAKY